MSEKTPRQSYQRVADGLYKDPNTGSLLHRPKIAGRWTWRKLSATTVTRAKIELAALRTRVAEAKVGIALDPYTEQNTINALAKMWLDTNCQDRNGQGRTGKALKNEQGRLVVLLKYFADKNARSLNPEDCMDYQVWRLKHRTTKHTSLARSVDLELVTLSNLLSWAAKNTRKTGLTFNPIANGRPKFQQSQNVKHCTSSSPQTDEQIHQLAAHLFSDSKSQALGWQLLLEALTGCRTSEILLCRMDATQPRQAGYCDDSALHIHRLKKGIEPWVLFDVIPGHNPLLQCMNAFKQWHRARYKSSPWFIPGRDPSKPAKSTSLTHAIYRACKELGLPRFNSHGLRAYHVRVLRSLRVDDSEIAKRLGQRSGVALVEKVYGVSEPGWFGSKRADFLPETGRPAWEGIKVEAKCRIASKVGA